MGIKRAFFLIIIIASLFIINNLVHSIYTLWTKKQLVENARMDVERQRQKNQEIKNKLSQVENPQFVEEEARNKLFLSKPGDQVIIISQKDLKANMEKKPKLPDTRPNWKKWWDLFI